MQALEGGGRCVPAVTPTGFSLGDLFSGDRLNLSFEWNKSLRMGGNNQSLLRSVCSISQQRWRVEKERKKSVLPEMLLQKCPVSQINPFINVVKHHSG